MKAQKIHIALCLASAGMAMQSTSLMAIGEPQPIEVMATLGTNSNVGQAEKNRDIINDNILSLTLGKAYKRELQPNLSLMLRGFLETEQLQEVRDLSRMTAGGEVSLRGHIGVGPTAPSYQFSVGVQVDEYEHSQRDSTIVTTQLMASKPLNDQFSVSGGVEYRDRDSSGTVFDLNQWRGFVGANYAFPPGWTVHGTYSYIDGDVWSTAQTAFCNGAVATDIYPLVAASDAIERDDAFNAEFCGNWLAYRLTAHTHTLRLGVSKDIGNSMSVDFSALGVQVDARGGNEYDTEIFRVSLTKRF